MKEIDLIKIQSILLFIVLAASMFLKSYLYIMIDYLVVGIFIGGIQPLLISFILTMFKKYSGTRLGILYAFNAAGAFIITTIIGILGDYFPIYRLIPFTSVFFLIIFLFFKKNISYSKVY